MIKPGFNLKANVSHTSRGLHIFVTLTSDVLAEVRRMGHFQIAACENAESIWADYIRTQQVRSLTAFRQTTRFS